MCKNEYDAHKALKGHRVVMPQAWRKPVKLSAWQRFLIWMNTP